MSSVELLKKEFVPKYMAVGEPKFYKFLLVYATNKLLHIEKENFKGKSPELEFLDYYERFIILYRREGENIYLDVGRSFRKAAHKIYRVMLKNHMIEKNSKFLNLV